MHASALIFEPSVARTDNITAMSWKMNCDWPATSVLMPWIVLRP